MLRTNPTARAKKSFWNKRKYTAKAFIEKVNRAMENVKKHFFIALTIVMNRDILKQSFRKDGFTDMKINFLGDSITQGAGASCEATKYVNVVGELLGCEARNYGEGGTRIAKQIIPSEMAIYDRDFLMRADGMSDDADFVFIFGGTNDYGHGDAPLGDVESTDEYTFCGAVNSLICKLSARYGKEKLCFILPLHRYNEDNVYGEGNKTKAGAPLSTYVALLKTLMQKHGVETLEFEKEFPIPATNDGTDGLTVDGLHPNDKGHRILAEKICAYIRAKR